MRDDYDKTKSAKPESTRLYKDDEIKGGRKEGAMKRNNASRALRSKVPDRMENKITRRTLIKREEKHNHQLAFSRITDHPRRIKSTTKRRPPKTPSQENNVTKKRHKWSW